SGARRLLYVVDVIHQLLFNVCRQSPCDGFKIPGHLRVGLTSGPSLRAGQSPSRGRSRRFIDSFEGVFGLSSRTMFLLMASAPRVLERRDAGFWPARRLRSTMFLDPGGRLERAVRLGPT